ncbi:BREX-1 system adenine-specific DNA-methyltransferase PglX [Sulfurimonas sediminis]|uniref:BREX-1 system adenine-specific DNA-methyltransferase PglX n=2 Tax=Sulfurimonas sediminis TaxID=2590020 RepID=A0A7M1B387_9BACT|nr:BREX-1 system adenine-specific DNA-methyltransferase PglX [Sulfurimonas sediminis]
MENKMATYIRLTDYKSSDEKEQEFFNPENRYKAKQEDFSNIPGNYIAYWLSDTVINHFSKNIFLGNEVITREGMATADNDRFLRYWNEANFNDIGFNLQTIDEANKSHKRWFPYNKGGEFRKWYGNNEYLVDWQNDGYGVKNNIDQKTGRLRSHNYNGEFAFQKGMTWAALSSSKISVRFSNYGFMFDSKGAMGFSDKNIEYFIALINSCVGMKFLEILAPTVDFKVGDIIKIPLIKHKEEIINTIVKTNISIAKQEWDSREISWDFTKNELIKHKNDSKIETAYSNYCDYWREKFNTLHQNEEELNKLFIDIYELQDELTPDVELKDITILKNETKIIDNELVFQADEIMKQFISYGVGVMFGRYSLDSDGLLIANIGQEVPPSTTFEIDDDNVIPVLEDDYFKDDIASRFVQFVKATFGEEDLSENIRFIENSLGTTLRKYFVKGFYEDHLKRYKKRPIYWMVASPKKGFMSLIYMHRYEADTFARVRNSYLTEYIAKLEAHKETLTLTTSSDTASNADKKSADKQMKAIDAKLKEIIEFDRDKMMHFAQNPTEIDLDDGVKVNYCKFRDILYPITGLCK